MKNCTCRLVKYCGVECQKAHRKQHKKACKQRAAELKDDKGLHSLISGNQNRIAAMKACGACERELPEESYSEEQRARRRSIRRCVECVTAGNQLVLMKKGRTRSEDDDCPICQLPLPLVWEQSMLKLCCMKSVCNGCILAARKHGMRNCPFCRQTLDMTQKRIDAGDPVAMLHVGDEYLYGNNGLEKDVARAIELYERAAELGMKEANYKIGCLYVEGKDVEKDTAKAIRHYEASAMCGHAIARHNLGCEEYDAGNFDIGMQHWKIAAQLGLADSLKVVKISFMNGDTTKADYAAALRGYQNANDEMSSTDRDEAKSLGRDKIIEM